MNFYLVLDQQQQDIKTYLQQAAEERSIFFHSIDVESFNYLNAPKLQQGDLLYKSSDASGSSQIEALLYHPQVATLYSGFPDLLTQDRWSHLICHAYGIPMPRTIFSLTTERTILDSYVEELGGYPVIIKALGGSHGVGVLRVDSAASLYSIVDYIIKGGGAKSILREYIPATSHARLIVLGDVVIDSIEYTVQGNDFRTNVGKPSVQAKKFSDAIEKTAVDVVRARGVEFGGVDIILDKENNHYVLEVNFPCYFPRAQAITGTNIAGKMLDYLLKKSEKIT